MSMCATSAREHPWKYDAMGMHVLTFRVGGSRIGFPLSAVREVLPAMAASPVAAAPPGVVGVIDLRGSAVTVFSLHAALYASRPPMHPQQRLVLATVRDRVIAFVVDAVEDLIEAGCELLGGDPATGENPWGTMVRDAHGPFFVIDPARCFDMAAHAASAAGTAGDARQRVEAA